MTQNWEINVSFKVSGKGKELFGDGFAIWYAKDRLVNGLVFGSKDKFSGLAIILDTYSNHNGPHNVNDNLYILYDFRILIGMQLLCIYCSINIPTSVPW